MVQGVVRPELPELHEPLGADLTLVFLVGRHFLLLDVRVPGAALVGVLSVHGQGLIGLKSLEAGVAFDRLDQGGAGAGVRLQVEEGGEHAVTLPAPLRLPLSHCRLHWRLHRCRLGYTIEGVIIIRGV